MSVITDAITIGFWLPHDDLKGHSWEEYSVSVDQLETFTGFDLFVLRIPVIWAEKGVAMCFGFDPDDTFEDLCMDLKDMEYARDHIPLVEGCDCLCCRNHTRSYVHHLLEVHEILAGTLLVMHNLRHYQRFFAAIRNEIKKTYN